MAVPLRMHKYSLSGLSVPGMLSALSDPEKQDPEMFTPSRYTSTTSYVFSYVYVLFLSYL